MLDPFTQLEATHAAHYTWSPWSLQNFMGCILPTTHCRSQQCWGLLHVFARSLTSSSLRTYHSLRLKLPFKYFSWNPTMKSVTLLCTDGFSLQLCQVEWTLDRTFERPFNVSVRFPMIRYSVIDSARSRTSVRRERLTKHENLLLGTQIRVRINRCPYKAI